MMGTRRVFWGLRASCVKPFTSPNSDARNFRLLESKLKTKRVNDQTRSHKSRYFSSVVTDSITTTFRSSSITYIVRLSPGQQMVPPSFIHNPDNK